MISTASPSPDASNGREHRTGENLAGTSRPGSEERPAAEDIGRSLVRAAWLVMLAAGTVTIVVYYLLPTAGFSQGILLTVLNGMSAGSAARAACRTRGRVRRVWVPLAVAMGFSTTANLFYYGFPLVVGRALPFPSGVDVFWLGTYPCFMVALFSLVAGRRRQDRRGDALDTAIIVAGGGSVMWQFLIGPAVGTHNLGFLAHVVAVAYPTMDLLVFAFFVRLVVSVSSRSPAVNLLLCSFLFLLAADTVYSIDLQNGSYHFGGPTDGLWMASYLLLGVAAVHPSRNAETRAAPTGKLLSPGRLSFLWAAILVGPLVRITGPRDSIALAMISGGAFLLVMARMTGLNRALSSASAELANQANTDALTGLANRFAFTARLEEALQVEPRGGSTQALVFVDLDDFKYVNDSQGHHGGDVLLQVVGERLRRLVRSEDLVARLGGDEFAIWLDLLPDLNAAREIASRIVESLNEAVNLSGQVVRVGVSVGVAKRRTESVAEALMHQADVAMYAAKADGKNRVVCFDPSLEVAMADHHALSTDLVGATDRGELFLEYQPCVDLQTGGVVGVEALVRWDHPTRGVLPPSMFIGIAEETGAISEIGRWVLHTAVGQVAQWHTTLGRHDLTLSVNVSGRQLSDRQLPTQVHEALRAADFPADRLILEVTESVLTDQGGAVLLETMRNDGIKIAIDDFGVGYSSMSYLHRLPVDILKIDRSFVATDPAAPRRQAVLEAIISLARHLELDVIAEGIEDPQQLARLEKLGCPIGQGYLFSRPIAPLGIENFIRDRLAKEAGTERHPRPLDAGLDPIAALEDNSTYEAVLARAQFAGH